MTKENLAYIAGFLDGDGCVMLQLVYRKDYLLGYQIRASIVFYQKQRYSNFLFWLKSKLKDGYIRDRNDGMTEYTIVGIGPVSEVLMSLLPYLRLKRKQALLALKVINQMPGSGRKMTPEILLRLTKEADKFVALNYSKKRTNTSLKLRELLKSRNLL